MHVDCGGDRALLLGRAVAHTAEQDQQEGRQEETDDDE